MTEIIEGSLTFQFSEGWEAISYDEAGGFYHRVIEKVPAGLKAVDILAHNPATKRHLWIEIKDCAGNEVNNKPRFSMNDSQEFVDTKAWIERKGYQSNVKVKRIKPYMPDEVAEKVIDTLTGVIASIRGDESGLSNFHTAVRSEKLDVVLFLTLNYQPKDYKRLALRLTSKIKARLNFLKPDRIFVINESTLPNDFPCTVMRTPS